MNLSLLLVLALAVAAGDKTHVPRVPGKTLPEAQSPNTRPVAVAVPESAARRPGIEANIRLWVGEEGLDRGSYSDLQRCPP